MTLLTRFLGAYTRTGVRGSYLLTKVLSHRLRSLQCISIVTESGILYADLRITSARAILANPKSQSGEDNIMRQFVREGDVVLDIGAHLGFYTLLLSKLAGKNGRVIAFEPNPEVLPSLRRTVEPLENVELITAALSDRGGEMEMFVPEDATMASLSDWTDGIAGKVHRVTCETHRLDELVETRKIDMPSFIKCDVEGAELSVFKGAAKTLDRADAPVIMFEANAKAAEAFGWRINDYFEYLESQKKARYEFFEVSPGGISELVSRDIQYANVVAVPAASRFLL